jgi:uncharacterized surface anchored protein
LLLDIYVCVSYASSAEDILKSDCDEVDANMAARLQTLSSKAQKTAIGTFRKQFPSITSTDAAVVLATHFKEESEKYANHAHARSKLYCEKVLQDAQQAVRRAPGGGANSEEEGGGGEVVKRERAEIAAKVLQVQFTI